MDKTTLLDLDKPTGDEPFARSTVNGNMDTIDKNLVAFAFGGVPCVGYTKAAMVFDDDGLPQSQAFTGPNGLTGTVAYVFTATTCTTTMSVTAPDAFSMTITTDLDDFSETGVES